jgi:hypothetical protein
MLSWQIAGYFWISVQNNRAKGAMGTKKLILG